MEISADNLYQKAFKLLTEGKTKEDLDQCEEMFNTLYNATLNHPIGKEAILFQLANVNMRKGRHALAIQLLEEVLKISPYFIHAYNNIGYIYKLEEMRDKAKPYFSKVLELANDAKLKDQVKKNEIADYYTNMGCLDIANGTPQPAVELLTKGLEYDPANTQARWNLALAYLELGDYAKGFANYDNHNRKEETKARNYTIEPTPIWDGTKGLNVVVYGEQGIGDELMFASVLPDVMKDANIILDAHPRLADLFRLNFPDIAVYGTRKASTISWPAYHPKIDARIQLGSLCKFYRNKKEDFPGVPYLHSDPNLKAKYAEKLQKMGDKPKIGISWKGGTKSTNKQHRQMPLELFGNTGQFENFDLISLQYHKDAHVDIEAAFKKTGLEVHHWPETLADYDETAALVDNLDLIISVPQSVVHLAGALGKTTWQLCPKRAMWQMGVYGEDMPWYSSVKNIWQDDFDDWDSVIKKVRSMLCSL